MIFFFDSGGGRRLDEDSLAPGELSLRREDLGVAERAEPASRLVGRRLGGGQDVAHHVPPPRRGRQHQSEIGQGGGGE